MAETVPTTWEEPRGPHLPDTLTGLPRPVWAFVAVAVVTVLADVNDIATILDTRFGPTPVISSALRLAATVAFPLWGAAFFWRHADGWRTARPIAIGTVLAAVYSLLDPIRSFVLEGFAFAEDFDRFVILNAILGAISAAIGIAAIAAVAVGLRRTRRRPDSDDSMRGLALVLVLVSVTTAALGLVGFRGIELTPVNIAALVENAVAQVGILLTWSALIVVTLAGWLADERPSRAWLLGAVAGALAIIGPAVFQTILLLGSGSTTGLPPGYEIGVWLGLLPPIVLLVAFALGLPSTAEPAWVDLEGIGTGGTPGEAEADAASVAVAGE